MGPTIIYILDTELSMLLSGPGDLTAKDIQ
jgi:hypothetical protein